MSDTLRSTAPPEPNRSDHRAMLLTEADVLSFHENGFLSIPAVTTAEELARITPIYDRLFEERAGYYEGNYFDFAGESDSSPALPQITMP
jgi:hypothetical protein